MAGFCRNCGRPLADGQAFCDGCGTPAAGPPVKSPATPSTPSAPPARPLAAPPPPPQVSAPPPPAAVAAPAKSGGSTLVKVLLIFLVVIFLLGAVGIAGVWYVAHRVKEKVHEIGLDQISTNNENRGPVLGGTDPCSLLSKADVGQAISMEVVRAEHGEGSDVGCEYSVMGDYVDMVAKHASLLHKADTDERTRQMMESFAKGIGHSTDSQKSAPKHPGEAPIFIFSVDNNNAAAQMSLNRATLGRLGPGVTPLPGIGDDAFDIANGMIFVRKGDKLLRIMYIPCPCTTDDVVPLAKKIVANM